MNEKVFVLKILQQLTWLLPGVLIFLLIALPLNAQVGDDPATGGDTTTTTDTAGELSFFELENQVVSVVSKIKQTAAEAPKDLANSAGHIEIAELL